MLAGVQVRNRAMKAMSPMNLFLGQRFKINASQATPTGWRSLLQSVTGLGSDLDAASLDDSEPPTAAPGAATQQRPCANCMTQARRAAHWPGVIFSKQFTKRE